MRVLAIDTATENCSVALRVGDKVQQLSELIPNGHSARVHAMVRELMEAQELELKDLEGIAVDIGPGSFTGVRIGIGIAQGLAFASGLPATGVGSLAALALSQSADLVLSAIDARMGQVYWCLFDTREELRPLINPLVSDPQDVALIAQDHVSRQEFEGLRLCGAGSGWLAYDGTMPTIFGEQIVEIIPDQYPTADSIARMVSTADFANPALLNAAYVRNDVAKKAAVK